MESCLPGERNAVVVAVSPENKQIPVQILNPRTEPEDLKIGEEIACLEPLVEEVPVAATEPARVQEDQQEIIRELVA